MALFIGKEVPNIVNASVVMPDNSLVKDFNLKSYCAGFTAILFFYPLDFTFVCPSEIIAFNNKLNEFKKRNTKVIAVSVDSHFTHLAYKKTPVEQGGIGDVQFPIIGDLTKAACKDYDVLSEGGMAFRGTFLIDKNFTLRYQAINDLPLGRSVNEILRLVDAWHHIQAHGEVCPANWTSGDAAIKPNQEGIANYLSNHADTL